MRSHLLNNSSRITVASSLHLAHVPRGTLALGVALSYPITSFPPLPILRNTREDDETTPRARLSFSGAPLQEASPQTILVVRHANKVRQSFSWGILIFFAHGKPDDATTQPFRSAQLAPGHPYACVDNGPSQRNGTTGSRSEESPCRVATIKGFPNVTDDLDTLLSGLVPASARPRVVLSKDGTERESGYVNVDSGKAAADVDGLFGTTQGYIKYKRERPEHRLMLWYRLQGYNVKETAQLTGYTPQTVGQVCKEPWFLEAFCRISEEQGKDAVQTFLEGEVLPALERTRQLAVASDSDAVKLAANRDLLDRYLGKSTVKVEAKTSGTIDHVVHDATRLLAESARLDEALRANGTYTHSTS